MSPTTYHTTALPSGLNIFYRACGPLDAPTVVLLHGYPSSSHQYRALIPLLAKSHRVLAPDLPGFGFTTAPEGYEYTFANFADAVAEWLDALGVRRFALYVFDYGAPTGFRLALARPHAIAGIVTQNGNAYEEGIGAWFDPIRAWWATNDPTHAATRAALHAMLSDPAHIADQYTGGTPADRLDRIDPATYALDGRNMDTAAKRDRQIDLFWDYRTNVGMYPAFHAYFRAHSPPVLAVWGKNDAIFVPAGAEGFARDNERARVQFVDGGHFALETHLEEIAGAVLRWLAEEVEW